MAPLNTNQKTGNLAIEMYSSFAIILATVASTTSLEYAFIIYACCLVAVDALEDWSTVARLAVLLVY